MKKSILLSIILSLSLVACIPQAMAQKQSRMEKLLRYLNDNDTEKWQKNREKVDNDTKAYDLAVTIEGKSMKEVALFVAQKLAPMDSIISTATHFVLKKYKEEGIVFEDDEKDTRQVITL